MRNRFMERRAKARRENVAASIMAVILIMVVVVSVPGLFMLFAKIDCYNATRNIEYIEACTAHDNCTLSQREMQRLEAYTRLQLKACPRD